MVALLLSAAPGFMLRLLLALVFTVSVEGALALTAFPRWRTPRLVGAVMLVNLVTLPALWMGLFFLPGSVSANLALLVGEALVWLVEAGVYYYARAVSTLARALILSLALNTASFLAGLWLPF